MEPRYLIGGQMPYIDNIQREKYKNLVNVIKNSDDIETKGDLEYLTYILMLKFMMSRNRKYSTLHESVYAVVHSAHEFERNFLDKRENEAREENGDITL